jgi:hypothetical protein
VTTVAKKCVSCGTMWSSALPNCPFCGGEASAEPAPKEVALLAGLPPRPEDKREDPDDTPRAPIPKVDAPPSGRSLPSASEGPPEPTPADPPGHKTEKIETPPPPAPVPLGPQVGSSNVPFVFGLLGLAACLALPLAVHFQEHRVLGILGPLAAGILSPFAPFAWLAGLRHEDRCRDLNLIPSGRARAGRMLGAIATFVLVFNITMLSVIAVVLRLSSAP